MPDDTIARELEPTPVQLTRMEGVLNLILFRMDDVVTRVIHLEGKVTQHDSDIAGIKAAAAARLVTAETVATTLKEKEDEAIKHSTQRWTPAGRTISVILAIGVLVEILAHFNIL